MTDLYELEERAYKALGDLADEYLEAGRSRDSKRVEEIQDMLWLLIKGEEF